MGLAQGGPRRAPHQSQWKWDSWRGQAVLIQWDLAFGARWSVGMSRMAGEAG